MEGNSRLRLQVILFRQGAQWTDRVIKDQGEVNIILTSWKAQVTSKIILAVFPIRRHYFGRIIKAQEGGNIMFGRVISVRRQVKIFRQGS